MSEITWRARRHRRRIPREHITNIRLGYKRKIAGEEYVIDHPGVFLTKGAAQKFARATQYRGTKSKVVTVMMAGKNVGYAVFQRPHTTRRVGRLSRRKRG